MWLVYKSFIFISKILINKIITFLPVSMVVHIVKFIKADCYGTSNEIDKGIIETVNWSEIIIHNRRKVFQSEIFELFCNKVEENEYFQLFSKIK